MKFIEIDASEKIEFLQSQSKNKINLEESVIDYKRFNGHNIVLGKTRISTPKIPFVNYEKYKIEDNQFGSPISAYSKEGNRIIFNKKENGFIGKIYQDINQTKKYFLPEMY